MSQGQVGVPTEAVPQVIATSFTKFVLERKILFLTGAQLALGAGDIPRDKGERFALMVTGASRRLEPRHRTLDAYTGLSAD